MSNSRLLLGLACLGVSVCAACGSSFTGGASGGAGGSGAANDAGAPSDGGSSAAAGDASGGASGSGTGGASAGSGGITSAGASGSGSGGHNTAGSGGAGTGGASAGAGGTSGKGGAAGSGGTGGGAVTDCKTLETQYAALVEKARVCDKGSTDECSPSSKLPAVGCGCPTLVNSQAEATTLAQKKYKELQDNMCLGGPVCGIACIAVVSASCAQQTMGTGTNFVCTGSSLAN